MNNAQTFLCLTRSDINSTRLKHFLSRAKLEINKSSINIVKLDSTRLVRLAPLYACSPYSIK